MIWFLCGLMCGFLCGLLKFARWLQNNFPKQFDEIYRDVEDWER